MQVVPPPNRRARLIIVTVVFVVVCASRIAVFPASIWEQDEAYFAAAVVELDLADSAPHPPFFPLWIAIGKGVHRFGPPPAASLQLASAFLGSLMFLPLVALWSRLMSPALATAAATLGLAAPGVWLLSGRAFSGTAATAMLVTALACWARPTLDRKWLVAGSLAAGLGVLVRPHFALVIAAVLLAMLAGPARRQWLALVTPAAVVTAVGAVLFVVAAGGPASVRAAVARHATLHFGALPTASRSLLDSGLVPALGHPAAAVAWCVLGVAGAGLALRSHERRSAALPVVAALVAAVVLVFGLSNPAHPRYAVPLVVLSCGFVVGGLTRLLSERWAPVAVATAVIGTAALVMPSAPTYRRQASPPLRAFDHADREAMRREGVVVADRTLHAFVVYREAVGRSASPTVFDHVIELGAGPPLPALRTVFVFDENHGASLVTGERSRTFTCDDGLLRRLAQGRFLDLTVAEGAVLDIHHRSR